MDKSRQLKLDGLKFIKHLDFELSPFNILIGANGSGKSNLISFFKMLNEMIAGRLQQHIGISGRATSLLHFGAKITPQMQANLEFEVERGVNRYQIRLCHASGDTLIFAEGQTEQTFADNLIRPHLANYEVYLSKPILIFHGKRKGKVHRGGGQNHAAMKQDKSRDIYFSPANSRRRGFSASQTSD